MTRSRITSRAKRGGGKLIIPWLALAWAACIGPQTARTVYLPDGVTNVPAAMPVVPGHRGVVDLATTTSVHSVVDHSRRPLSDEVSYYVPTASTDAALGYRITRVVEIRALGTLALPWGAHDVLENQARGPVATGRLGLGLVLGFASEAEPFQLQITADVGPMFLGRSAIVSDEFRFCAPPARFETDCGPWMLERARDVSTMMTFPYLRVSALAGIDLLPDFRLFVQGMFSFEPFLGSGLVTFAPAGSGGLTLEWHVTRELSLLASGVWPFADPLLTYGPSGSLGIRIVRGEGPGHPSRTEREAHWRIGNRFQRVGRRERGLLRRRVREEAEQARSARWNATPQLLPPPPPAGHWSWAVPGITSGFPPPLAADVTPPTSDSGPSVAPISVDSASESEPAAADLSFSPHEANDSAGLKEEE